MPIIRCRRAIRSVRPPARGTGAQRLRDPLGVEAKTRARTVTEADSINTVGVLAQTNFGGNLTIAGVPVFKTLMPPRSRAGANDNGDGSCMLVVATDAPLDARDLRRLAARAVFGLGRTGSSYSNGSGDFAIAFSTAPEMRSRFNETAPHARTVLPTDATSPLFEAALEATEEAVYNSLFAATSVQSSIGTADAQHACAESLSNVCSVSVRSGLRTSAFKRGAEG